MVTLLFGGDTIGDDAEGLFRSKVDATDPLTFLQAIEGVDDQSSDRNLGEGELMVSVRRDDLIDGHMVFIEGSKFIVFY